ncbi:MAG: V-type ATP synthase subunit I, partial [Halobacteria archaeon]|nr:V-type ATP synthase subunit I [Halobacteria archaeon]
MREQQRQIEPFVNLGIDLELLRGYDSIEVMVGNTGDVTEIRQALRRAEGVEEFELFSEGDADEGVVVVAASVADDAHLSDVLVGVDFNAVDVPQAEGSPAELMQELRTRQENLESKIEELDERRKEIKADEKDFLLALEEQLSIEVQKGEIPLQ